MRQQIWYCRRCRLVLKVEPRWSMKPTCKCAVPQIGQPTTVWS